jgi:hypothetical protein
MGLDKLVTGLPVVGGFFDNSDEEIMNLLKQNQGLYGDINTPNLSQYAYSPEEYSLAGDYDPEMAQASTISEDPKIRSAQLSALNKMSGLADTGLSEVDELGYAKAKQMGAQQSRAGREAAIQDANARGVGGSGLEFALREIANQEGATRAQNAGLDQAADSARQRALYTQAYGNALSGVRGEDLQANSANADILNRFNMANTQTANQAQQANLQARQTVNNANVDQRNAGKQQQLTIAQQNYENQLKKAQGLSGANTGIAQGYAAQSAANAGRRKSAGALAGAGIGFMAGGPTGAMVGGSMGGAMG